jgi:hypothetical protein
MAMQATTTGSGSTRSWSVLTAVLWVLTYLGARAALKSIAAGSALSVVVVLTPIIPFAAMLYLIIRQIRTMDELERRIQLEALAIAFPLSVLLVMLLGLLQLAVELNPNDWSYRHIWPFMGMFWVVGAGIARKKYS